MSHHHHDHGHHVHTNSTKNVSFAFFVNLLFTIIEIIGGLYTNSISILSDALHDLGDSFSLGLAWYLQKFSNKKRDRFYSYGYKRYSVLGALINSLILIAGSIFIIIEAIKRLSNPEAVDAKGMIFFAILGILFNGVAYFSLHKTDNLNEKIVSLHLLEDVLGWVAVLIGSIIIYFFDWPVIDPILSLLISLFILYNVFRNLNKSISIIMQGIPPNLDIKTLESEIKTINQIESIHDLRVWTMDGSYNIMTVHVVLHQSHDLETLHEIKCAIKEKLRHKAIQHVTIEFEIVNESCELINQ
jgi:cobalt-zinc-cadmium efflux system protein